MENMNRILIQLTWTGNTAMQIDRLASALAALESLSPTPLTVMVTIQTEEAASDDWVPNDNAASLSDLAGLEW